MSTVSCPCVRNGQACTACGSPASEGRIICSCHAWDAQPTDSRRCPSWLPKDPSVPNARRKPCVLPAGHVEPCRVGRPEPTDQGCCTCVWDEPGALQWRNPDCPQHGRPQTTDSGDRS